MATTTSLGFPKMFGVAQNVINVLEDNASVVNRTRLLILTEPTELYNNPQFGVGLKRHLWQYNNENERARIRDRIVEQLRLHEPCVLPDSTQVVDGLAFTGGSASDIVIDKMNKLHMTVGLVTTYGANLEVTPNDQ